MKVSFIYTNINGFHEDCYSFGLSSIVSMTKKYGHEVEVILVRNKNEYATVLSRIEAFKPSVVGFSAVSSQFHFVKEIAGLIKESLPETIIVSGGVHPTIAPHCVKELKALDAVFVGESELAFIEFLNTLGQGNEFREVDNLAYADNDRIVVNRLKPLIKDLDELPFSDRNNVLFQETLRTVGYAPFFFSRGCPYLCSYCSNHAIAKVYGLSRNNPRYRSTESSIREIEEVIDKFLVSKIGIVDDTFGIDKEWRREFCEKYAERIRIKFFCLLRANFVDEEFICLLKDAGCFRVSIGVESGNEYIRNSVMNRQLSQEQIIKAFDMAHKYGLETNALNIIGVPGETEEMIQDTINLNRRLRPDCSAANIFYPYKGTVLGDYCFKEGLVDEGAYEDFSNERRTTVLRYSPEFKRKLDYYHKNWEILIHKDDIAFRFKRIIKGCLTRVHIWWLLVRFKRFCLSHLYSLGRVKFK